MQKVILTLNQVNHLIGENRYKVDPKTKFIARCIDGRYLNDPDLPALAFPGADAGEMALIFATGNSYGFEVDDKLAYKSLTKIIGGVKNLRSHSDSHARGAVMGGCGHIKQATLDSETYKLEPSQIEFIKKQPFKEIMLEGEHMEGAVLLVHGNYGIHPQCSLETDSGDRKVQVFIYHQSLVDERHRVLAKTLIKNKAVKLPPGCDEEYLYEAMSEVAETHLMETARRLAKGLPIFAVTFKEGGDFKLEEVGTV